MLRYASVLPLISSPSGNWPHTLHIFIFFRIFPGTCPDPIMPQHSAFPSSPLRCYRFPACYCVCRWSLTSWFKPLGHFSTLSLSLLHFLLSTHSTTYTLCKREATNVRQCTLMLDRHLVVICKDTVSDTVRNSAGHLLVPTLWLCWWLKNQFVIPKLRLN